MAHLHLYCRYQIVVWITEMACSKRYWCITANPCIRKFIWSVWHTDYERLLCRIAWQRYNSNWTARRGNLG